MDTISWYKCPTVGLVKKNIRKFEEEPFLSYCNTAMVFRTMGINKHGLGINV